MYFCLKIRLQAGFEPSTLSVQKKCFLHSTYFNTAASMANSSYYNVNPINCLINFNVPDLFQYKQTADKQAYGTNGTF